MLITMINNITVLRLARDVWVISIRYTIQILLLLTWGRYCYWAIISDQGLLNINKQKYTHFQLSRGCTDAHIARNQPAPWCSRCRVTIFTITVNAISSSVSVQQSHIVGCYSPCPNPPRFPA